MQAAATILASLSACRPAWQLSGASASQGQPCYQEGGGRHSVLRAFQQQGSVRAQTGGLLLPRLPSNQMAAEATMVLNDQKLTLSRHFY